MREFDIVAVRLTRNSLEYFLSDLSGSLVLGETALLSVLFDGMNLRGRSSRVGVVERVVCTTSQSLARKLCVSSSSGHSPVAASAMVEMVC